MAVGRPLRRVSASAKNVTSPRVADIRRKRAWGSVRSGVCHATPRSRSAYQWNSSITTSSTAAASPSRRAMLARISAVQHRMGASRLIEVSPVDMPTFSAPNSAQASKNFSLTSALIGQV